MVTGNVYPGYVVTKYDHDVKIQMIGRRYDPFSKTTVSVNNWTSPHDIRGFKVISAEYKPGDEREFD